MSALRLWSLRALAVVAFGFGLATIRAGASVLFGDGAAAAGHYFPLVVWFNFLAGFLYLAAAVGLWRPASWGARLALGLALLTALVFAAFGTYVAMGAAFEARTVLAMTARTALWAAIAALAWPRHVRPAKGQIV